MQNEWKLTFSSRLAVTPEIIWIHISTMQGVNEELTPLMRMTYPSAASAANLAEAPVGEVLFHSWLLFLGFLPIDRHHLCLSKVDAERGFIEESTSWSQAYWRHERTIEAAPGGCILTDNLTFRPRLFVLGPAIAMFVRRLFTNRHHNLKRKFGELAPVS